MPYSETTDSTQGRLPAMPRHLTIRAALRSRLAPAPLVVAIALPGLAAGVVAGGPGAVAQEAVTIPAVTVPGVVTTPTEAPVTTPAPTTTVAPTTAPPPPTTAAPTTVAPTTVAPTTVAPTTVPPTTAPAPTTTVPAPTFLAPGPKLRQGNKGAAVLALETRLAQLKIETGKVDGVFDSMTWQGVVGFQKLEGLKRTGIVDDAFRSAINVAVEPAGIIPNGGAGRDHIEVDISRQVMFLYKGGSLYRVYTVSTGSNIPYCEMGNNSKQRVCGKARTPRGTFTIQRRIKGWRVSDLGRLYNPLYFTGGFAFHGGPPVPAHPASHGCIRIPNPVAEYFPSLVKNGTRVYVYD